MNYQKIRKLQKENGVDVIQRLIDNGSVWHLEGTVGRQAMELLSSGACMLPKQSHKDAYGNYIPSRDEVATGSTGSYKNSVKYWESIHDYDAMYI
jgi:hypothetical protein